MEKWLRISVSLDEEKGMELVTTRGTKGAPGGVLVKCNVIFVPGRRSFSRKKSVVVGSSLTWVSVAA